MVSVAYGTPTGWVWQLTRARPMAARERRAGRAGFDMGVRAPSRGAEGRGGRWAHSNPRTRGPGPERRRARDEGDPDRGRSEPEGPRNGGGPGASLRAGAPREILRENPRGQSNVIARAWVRFDVGKIEKSRNQVWKRNVSPATALTAPVGWGRFVTSIWSWNSPAAPEESTSPA